MRDHVRLLGILNIVYSGIGLVISAGLLLLFGGVAGIVNAVGAAESGEVPAGWVATPLIAIVGIFIVALVSIISLPGLIGGIGLLKFQNWARILMIVVSIFHLFSFPFGTALGVYGIWVLFNDQVRLLLAGTSAATRVANNPGANWTGQS